MDLLDSEDLQLVILGRRALGYLRDISGRASNTRILDSILRSSRWIIFSCGSAKVSVRTTGARTPRSKGLPREDFSAYAVFLNSLVVEVSVVWTRGPSFVFRGR